jgi:hypothetical protein
MKKSLTPEDIDINVVVSPQPTTGVSRHIGGVHPGGMHDDKAIAKALRKIAHQLDPQSASDKKSQYMSDPPKLTIEDLEHILATLATPDGDLRVEILPSGEVRAFRRDEPVPQGPVRVLTARQALGDGY